MKKPAKKATNKVVAKVRPLSKGAVVRALAETSGLSIKDVKNLLDCQLQLAYDQAAEAGFQIHGLGKLFIRDRKARMGRNPMTGESIQIAAKKVLKFRIAKQAKDAIVGAPVKKSKKVKTTKTKSK